MRRQIAQRGWTLVEAMITLMIIGCMSAAAAPSVKELIDAAYRDALASDAMTALWTTRSEAIKRADQVVLCKSKGLYACSADGDWAQGWLAFHDLNGNAQLDDGEEVLLRRDQLPLGWRLSGNVPLANYVAYQSLGHTRLLSGGFQAGTFTLCRSSSSPTTAVRIMINSMGRPRTEKVQVAAC